MIYTSSIFICSASAQKVELKVVGVFEVRVWSGAGVSVLVCTREQRLRWIGGGLACFSRYYNITHFSLPACMHCMHLHGILEGTRA